MKIYSIIPNLFTAERMSFSCRERTFIAGKPAFPWGRKGSGDVSAWSLGPGPGETPSRQGLAASLRRRGCPAWSCVRHGSRLRLLPCRPSSRRPHHATSALSPFLPGSRPPGPAGSGGRGAEAAGQGRNAPPAASGRGAGKPSPSPHRPERGRGPGAARRRRRPGPPAPARPRPRSRE